MSALATGILISGASLEIALLWRVLLRGLWRSYPYFSLFLLWMAMRTGVGYAIKEFVPTAYQSIYWKTDSLDVVFRFLLVWEVFRHTFPAGAELRRNLSKGFGAIGTGLLVLAVGMFWSFETYSKVHSVYPALERSFDFAQAVMILGVLLTARYYGVQLGRNIWGLAVAFGAWASISTANNAVIDLAHSFLPFWRLLRPVSFVAMVGMWTWAMWAFAPNPPLSLREQTEQETNMAWWQDNWNRTISAARKVTHS